MTLVEFYKRLCQKLKARRKRIPSLPEVVVMLRSKELFTSDEVYNPSEVVLFFDNATGYVKITSLIQMETAKKISSVYRAIASIGEKGNCLRPSFYSIALPSPDDVPTYWVACLINVLQNVAIECNVIACIYAAIEFFFTVKEAESDKVNQYTFFSLYTGPPGIRQLFSISIPLRRVLFASDIL